MKPGANKGKGQRSIQSFLFKPKAAAQSAQTKSEQHCGENKAACDTSDIIPPNKKPRLSRTPTLPEPVYNSTGKNASAVPDMPHRHATNDQDALQPLAGPPASTDLLSSPPHTVPARVEHRHQRFQQKLVMGAGNKTYKETQKLSAMTKPKYTPLELQIVELKERHPGVLLIVEVSSYIASPANSKRASC